jgi:hypothetical protein
VRALAVAITLATRLAAAQVGSDATAILRDANAAAIAGAWARVAALVQPLFARPLDRPLDRAELAEAHRLEGLVMYFAHREIDAEAQFVAYLQIDLDGHLDPALYPPEVIGFFDEVRAKHAAELHVLRPRPRRSILLNFLPPAGQFQNGDRTKGWVIAGALGALAITNVTSYLLIRDWCTPVTGTAGSSLVCDQTVNHDRGARIALDVGVASGIGFLLTYAFGVYDGVSGYRRRDAAVPFAVPAEGGGVVGLAGAF